DFLRRFLWTVGEVFPAVRAYPVDSTRDTRSIQNVLVVAAAFESDLPPVEWSRVPAEPEGPALTDDWAPVEFLQARVFTRGPVWR
ncbi:MAG TPA: hypothetical protein VGA70_06395, partial [Longimicrobiales bacterium]